MSHPDAGYRPGPVVITGASSGIGYALACEYADPGRPVLLVGRSRESLAGLAEKLRGRGACPEVGIADVRDGEVLDRLASGFAGRHGPVSVLVASAGISHGTLTSEKDDRRVFADILTTNVLGMQLSFSAFLPYMQDGGRIAGIASVAGFRGLPGAAAYSASKAAVICYLESLRLELRPRNILVTCIAPGYIATPMTAENAYPMPWLMPVDRAAMQMRRAIDLGRPWLVVPWQMAATGWFLKHLPRFLYDRIASRMGTKARRISAE